MKIQYREFATPESFSKPPGFSDSFFRRSILGTGLARSLISSRALAGMRANGKEPAAPAGSLAAKPEKTSRGNSGPVTLLDQFAVSQIIGRESFAGETHDYDMEAACFHPDAYIDVSWLSGTAAEFVEKGRKTAARENGKA